MQKRLEYFFENLLKTPAFVLFLALCAGAILILWTRIQLVENQTIAYQILQEQGRFGIFTLFNSLKYLGTPLIYGLKITLIAFVLWTGAFMYGYKISFGQMWKIAIIGEFVFLFAELLKVAWLIWVPYEPTIWDIRAFYPLSLMNFFNYETLPNHWIYPLQAINLFEPINWLVLVYGIHFTARKKLDYAYAIVFTTYVPLFLIWLVYYVVVYH
ncbi:MAG: hypothetical protein KDC79_12660 [Cyclobacteriaceae bacterium]|nr:hypothetical protein [Cyclobacteriaceae bacterium]